MVACHRAHDAADQLRSGHADRVGQRDRPDAEIGNAPYRLHHFAFAPRIAIRISECHRDVNDRVENGVVGTLLDRLQYFAILLERLVLVLAQKCRGDRVRIAEGRDALGGNGALCAFLINDDSDDLDVIRRVELLQHFLAVRHLRDSLRRNEAHGINVLEPRVDQRAQVLDFYFDRDLSLETLPSVPGALDKLDGISHWHLAFSNLEPVNSHRPFSFFRLSAISDPPSKWCVESLRRASRASVRFRGYPGG